MLHFDLNYFQEAFNENWEDWCLGSHGGTRFGDPVSHKSFSLTDHYRVDLSVKEVLSKNSEETKRWHINFLEGYSNLYFEEYLKPRYSLTMCEMRIFDFHYLLNDIRKNGVRKPVWVAEVNDMMFRFDGCHRTCCAYVCNMKTVPALVFKTKSLN